MPKSSKALKPVPSAKTPTKFKSRDLAGASPLKDQFEPTPAAPVRQRYRMGGGA